MKKFLFLMLNIFLINNISFSQNVGIGTTLPTASLHVADSSVLFSATGIVPVSPGEPPVSGTGRRTMWYPAKAAFRAGYVAGSEWDKDNLGIYSFASGYSTIASGGISFASGFLTIASGDRSFAGGNQTTASGPYSVAMGTGSSSSGTASFALGYNTLAGNDAAFATGFGSVASGYYSTAMGSFANAYAIHSRAFGFNVTASGNNSTAIGNYVSTSGYTGAFVIGDNSTTTIMPSFVANGFRARFAGGYRLLTNSAATIGVVLLPDGNSWAAISDVRLKENFIPVNGEHVLKSIAALPQFTWNYKAQDAKTLRHYGPMAQDFYKAFGKDDLGEIGCDTLINQQDFLGVNLIAIQALEKRTTALSNGLEKALELINLQAKEIDLLKAQNVNLSIINKK